MPIRDLNDLLYSIQSEEEFYDEDECLVSVDVSTIPKINLYQEDKINILIEMYNEFSLEELQGMLKQFKFQKKFIATQKRMLDNNIKEQERLKNQSIRV